jgi:hypothetical protein
VGVTAVHISIDELVLHGVDRRDRDAIADAIRIAIAEHLDPSLVRARIASIGRADRLVAADVAVPSARAEAVGAGVGRAVAHALAPADTPLAPISTAPHPAAPSTAGSSRSSSR